MNIDARNNGDGGINEIEALLPWFAAGTLSRKDAARVEEALSKDADLSRRFALVREELGEAIRLNESLGAPSTRAMARLFEKIDAEAPRTQRAMSAGLSVWISEFIASLSPRTLAWSGAAAAFAILLQAGIITGVLMQDRGGYGLASHDAGVSTSQTGAYAQIRFAPGATSEEITKFLQDNKATIVGGPAAGTGMYRVKVAMTGLAKDDLARLVRQLQENKVVGFAAPAP
jgi:hypothetical protein